MRLVFDSNVIIAAFATRGICQALLEASLENHDVFICEEMLEEIRGKLLRKIKLPLPIADEVEAYLRDSLSIVAPAKVAPDVCRDEDDRTVLGTAAAAHAQYLVTGDKDLLILKNHGRTRILDPRSFWDVLKRAR